MGREKAKERNIRVAKSIEEKAKRDAEGKV